MISVNNAARLIKRAILANIATDKENVAITPLISGKHGIGKSAIVKTVAEELSGICITIEGGTLKEGEITGIPYGEIALAAIIPCLLFYIACFLHVDLHARGHAG